MSSQAAPINAASGTPGTPQFLFNQTYALSKPIAMQALFAGQIWGPAALQAQLPPSPSQRASICSAGQAAGYNYDEEIDFLGWDPWTVMSQRESMGILWIPAGQGGGLTAMLNPAQFQALPVPANGLKVSTVLADFPPFPIPVAAAPAAPPPIPQIASPVGGRLVAQNPQQANSVGDVFTSKPNDGWAPGSTWSGSIPGFSGTWQKQGLELGMLIAWVKTA